MKYAKIVIFIIIICLFGLIFVCINRESFADSNNPQSITEKQNQEYTLKNYCRVFEIEPTNNINYKYRLISKDGHIVFEDTTFRLPPSFMFINDTIIKIHIGAGPGVFSDRFFDVSNNMVSEPFYVPCMTHQKMVVSIRYIADSGYTYLMIQDMFNQSINYLYEKIDVENTSFPNNSIMNIRFISDYVIWLKYKSLDGSINSKLYFLKNINTDSL